MSASAPCTPSSSHNGHGGGIGSGGCGDHIDSHLHPSHHLHIHTSSGHATAPVTRPSSPSASSSALESFSPGFDVASESGHSARTSMSASSSPFMSLPRSCSPDLVQAQASISTDCPCHASELADLSQQGQSGGTDASTTCPLVHSSSTSSAASSSDSSSSYATTNTTSVSPALSQLPPTVLHELIASATSNLYIRGLPMHVTDSHLFSLCSPHGHVLSAKSIVDLRTGQCKGYGFVLFARPHDAVAAMVFINKNPFVLGGPGLQASMARESFSAKLKVLQDDESANVYLSNLPSNMDEQALIQLLQPIPTLSVRILVGPTGVSRGVGFARLANRDAAHQVIVKLNRLTLEPGLPPLQVRFADSPAQKMLKAVTCPPPPRKGPPGPARPCAGEMPPPRSHSYPAAPRHCARPNAPAPPQGHACRDQATKRVGSDVFVYGTESPAAAARSVVQSVLAASRGGASSSMPRPSQRHGHGRHSSGSSWDYGGHGQQQPSQQERGRTMLRRLKPSHHHAKSSKQPGSNMSSSPPSPHLTNNSTPPMLCVPFPAPTPSSTSSVPGLSTHDPSTGYPLPMPMTLIPQHAPDAPHMYFVAMDPSATPSFPAPTNPPFPLGPAPTATPCHIAYAAVDQFGQPLMTWAIPCTAITAPTPAPAPAIASIAVNTPDTLPPAIQPVITPMSPIPSPTPLSPASLAPWSATSGAAGAGSLLSSPPVGPPPMLTSSSSMDELTLPSMSTAAAAGARGAETMCGGGSGMPRVDEADERMDHVVKPRAKSFTVSMLMSAGGNSAPGV